MRTAARDRRPAVAALLLGLAALPLGAQGEAVFREEIEVRLIELEVVVTDPDGEPITGLTRDDFELRQGRKRIEPIHFAAYEDGRHAGDDLRSGVTAAERLHLVIYLDQAHLGPGESRDAIAALPGFLGRALRPGDRGMLVAANHSLEIVQPFTGEPDLLVAALRGFEPEPARGRATVDFPRLLQEIERTLAQGPDVGAVHRDERPLAIRSQIESFAAEVQRELEATAHQLQRLIPALAGLPGRKEIVYLGGALPTTAGEQLYSAWRTAFGPGSAFLRQRTATADPTAVSGLDNVLAQPAVTAADAQRLFERVTQIANASGVTLHMIDAGGLRQAVSAISSRGVGATEQGGGVAYGGRVDAGRRLGDPQVFRRMAESTGGRHLIHSHRFDHVLAGVAADLVTYYSLAFRPPSVDDWLHEVRVRLKGKRSRATVRYRRAYRARDRDRVAADRAATALILGETDNPLGIELTAESPRPIVDESRFVRLPLAVIFPLSALTLVPDGQGGHRGRISLYLTAGDFERGASQVQKTVVPFQLSGEELETAIERRIEYRLELPMATGSRRVAVAVFDDHGPRAATAVLELNAFTATLD